MPAGPVGSVWASGTWPDTVWEANTWADAGPPPPVTAQSPRASRYRLGYRVDWTKAMLWIGALFG